ncbi:DNA/RNA non-specific endonuclease [Flammeovirgaceae bacterium 311]|nr:DNA/RNA non-specific endonuclease [Flammeovirgaceae bacterium 311]
MKRYSNTKKFLFWFFLFLLVLFALVVVWRGLKNGASMRLPETLKEQPREEQRTEPEDETVDISLAELAEQSHFGWPASPFHVLELLEFKAYALAYDEAHEQAAWVAYRLLAREKGVKHERYDRFMADNRVSTGSADPDDYSNSGYDRGHLAPAGDFSADKEAMKESFYMSNMSPQEPSFNRGIWSKLENQVRNWADEHEEVWVITGPVLLNQKRLKKIGNNKVSVPRYYYKVVLDVREPEIKMIGFVMKNSGSSEPLNNFILPVDSIESLTGLDFFPMLPDELEEAMESRSSAVGWF